MVPSAKVLAERAVRGVGCRAWHAACQGYGGGANLSPALPGGVGCNDPTCLHQYQVRPSVRKGGMGGRREGEGERERQVFMLALPQRAQALSLAALNVLPAPRKIPKRPSSTCCMVMRHDMTTGQRRAWSWRPSYTDEAERERRLPCVPQPGHDRAEHGRAEQSRAEQSPLRC
jgi:hypothetical protein